MKTLLLIMSISFMMITFYNLLFNKKSIEIKKENLEKDIQKEEEKVPYIIKGDNSGQTIYENTKNKVLNFLKTQLKNKLELSWQFLYDITDVIVKKFSSEDKNAINEIGQNLLKNGVKYEHVINFGINLEKLKTKANKINNKDINIF